MDRTYKQMCEMFTPKMNEVLMRGHIMHEIKSQRPEDEGFDFKMIEDRINNTLHKAYHGLFDGRLHYGGAERCTPQEEFDYATRPKNTRRVFELAQSDLYLIKAPLHYDVSVDRSVPNLQHLCDIYLYLPCPREAGVIHIGGPLYQLIPIVSDKVVSPEGDYLFVRLEQYKMKFFRGDKNYPVFANGQVIHGDVYWANIYKQKQGKKKTIVTKALSTLGHYMFARSGFSQTFQKFAGFVPITGTAETVNENIYPPESWVIVSSGYPQTVIRPPTVIGNFYEPTKIRLAIPKDKWNTATQALVINFFYVIDAFFAHLTLDNIESPEPWKICLGLIISDSKFTNGKLLGVVEEHFSSTDTYVDELSIEKLAEKGLHISNFNELLGLIVTRYNELRDDGGQSQIMYGKYIDTMREMLYPITYSIYQTKYQLMKLAGRGTVPSFNAVAGVFIRKFKSRPFFNIMSKGIVAEGVSYSGDHMYYKITSRLSQQESTPGTRSSKGRKITASMATLNTSMFMVGSILFLSKKKPEPMSHANPFMKIDLTTGTILEDPEFKEVLAEVDRKLEMKG